MLRLPTRFAAVILSFTPLFFQRSWRHAEVLLIGAILAPGKRTVSSLLRIGGLAQERRFVNYHRVLNRAAWSPPSASRLLLSRLISAFSPSGPVVPGIDEASSTWPSYALRVEIMWPFRSGPIDEKLLKPRRPA